MVKLVNSGLPIVCILVQYRGISVLTARLIKMVSFSYIAELKCPIFLNMHLPLLSILPLHV
jgi:hypothetical protein